MGGGGGNGHSRKGLGFIGFVDSGGSQLPWVSPHLLCLARRAMGGDLSLYIHWLIMDLPKVLEGQFVNSVIHFTNEETGVAKAKELV